MTLRVRVAIAWILPLIWAGGAWAEIPAPILQMQEMHARQGVCEAGWREAEASLIHENLSEGVELWLIPCALWAHNAGWTAYVTIAEPTHPDGFITKAIRFIHYDPYAQLAAGDLVYNILWNSESRTLLASYFLNGSPICGTRSVFQWNEAQQDLQLQVLLKRDDCKNPAAPWEPLIKLTPSKDPPLVPPADPGAPASLL